MNVLPAFNFHFFQEKASYSDGETKLLALLQKQVQNAEKMCVIMSNTGKESKHIINESQQIDQNYTDDRQEHKIM